MTTVAVPQTTARDLLPNCVAALFPASTSAPVRVAMGIQNRGSDVVRSSVGFGDAEVCLHLNTPTSPAVLTAAEADASASGFTYLVMPVQIRS